VNRNNYIALSPARYPALRILLLFSAGILAANFLPIPLPLSTVAFITLFLVWCYGEHKLRQNVRIWIQRVTVSVYLFMVFSLGVQLKTLSDGIDKIPEPVQLLRSNTWEDIELTATILQSRKSSSGNWNIDLLSDNIKLTDSLFIEEQIKVRLSCDSSLFAQKPELNSKLIVSATILPFPEKRNPLQFDYGRFLERNGIYLTLSAQKIADYSQSDTRFSWLQLRKILNQKIDALFSEQTAAIAKALLIGYKQDLDYETRQSFSRSGLSHIMAVSGLHVGFVVAPFWLLIPYLWGKKYGRQTGLLFLVFLLFIYCGVTGFTASVVRASVTAVFLIYGKLFHKVRDSVNLTSAAALLILLIDPNQLFEIGFQLSFSAVYIILLTLPVLQGGLPYWFRFKWYAAPCMAVIVSLIVQIGLFPIQVFYFQEVSFIGPVSNALFVPLLSIIVPFSLLCVACFFWMPEAAFLMNIPNDLFLSLMYQFVEWVSGFPNAWIQIPGVSAFTFFMWISGIFWVASWKNPALRWKFFIVFLSSLLLFQSNRLYHKFLPKQLTITFFDVGQGDAALLKTPAQKHILVDAGRWSPSYSSGKYVIIPYLQNAGITTLDAVILSHPHADHIGGITDVMSEIEIKHIYNSGFVYNSRLYENYLAQASELGIPVSKVNTGDSLFIDPALLIHFYHPLPGLKSTDANQHSVIMEIVYGDTEILFTGDAEAGQERLLSKHIPKLIDTDVLKVGHHGSKTSSTDSFLHALTPNISIISAGINNRFNHPHPQAVQNLQEIPGNQVLITARDRAIVLTSDGEKVNIKKWK